MRSALFIADLIKENNHGYEHTEDIMPEYIVYKKETYYCPVRVTADTLDEAVSDVYHGEGAEQDDQHIRTEDDWLACEAPEDGSIPYHQNVTHQVNTARLLDRTYDEDEYGRVQSW